MFFSPTELASLLDVTAHIAFVLQILADPFETRFNPFTLERPRVSAAVRVPRGHFY